MSDIIKDLLSDVQRLLCDHYLATAPQVERQLRSIEQRQRRRHGGGRKYVAANGGREERRQAIVKAVLVDKRPVTDVAKAFKVNRSTVYDALGEQAK